MCTGTGRIGPRHADLCEYTVAHVQSSLLHLGLVQRQLLTHVKPEKHLSPCGVDKLRDGGGMLSLLLQTQQQKLSQH